MKTSEGKAKERLRNSASEMREIMRQRGDLFVAEGIGDIGHGRAGAAGSHARFVIVQRLDQIFLALPSEPGHRFRARVCIGMA